MSRENHPSPRALCRIGDRAWSLRGLAGWALLLLCSTMAPAQAGFVNGSYKINIGESARTLNAMLEEERGEITHEQFAAIKMEEMWKSPGIRLVDRNRPVIVLQNTSDPTLPNELTRFTIDIEQLGYEFGTGDFATDPFAGELTYVSKYSDPGVTLSSSYGTVSEVDLTPDPTKLVLDISGLTAGKALMFRVDLDPVPIGSIAFPDYQYILLGGDIGDGNGPATPAMISALFTAGEGESLMSTATQPAPLAPGMQQTFPTQGLLEAYHFQSSSSLYQQTGGTEVPEPTAALLLLAGLAGLLPGRLRSR